MSSPFRGFPPEALQFFRGLSRNNRREWFLPRKPLFEKKVKEPMRQLVDALNAALHDFAPEYETDPDKAIFRIYRDVRFSKDKKPYKEQIAATFHRHGSMSHGQGGYYVAISHKSVAVGGGVYMPEPPQLLAIRQHIAERHEESRPSRLPCRSSRRRLAPLQILHSVQGTFAAPRHFARALQRYRRPLPRYGSLHEISHRVLRL